MAFYSPVGNSQTEDDDSNLAVGWRYYTYLANSSTPATTYTDEAGTVPQSQPIVLNALGFPTLGPIFLTGGQQYKFQLTDENDVVKRTFDDISGIGDVSTMSDQWVVGPTPTYVSATSFTLVGDQTSAFHIGRRLKLLDSSGNDYGIITASVFTALTTVTVLLDSGALDAGLSAVSYGLESYVNTSLPGTIGTPGTFLNAIGALSQDAGALAGPTIELYRDSASPAIADQIGKITFFGEDSAGNKQDYASLVCVIDDPTSGAEVSHLLATVGSNAVRITSSGITTGTSTPQGVGTVNVGGIYRADVEIFPSVKPTSVSASGTSVDFTSIPSWVKQITVSLSGISTNGTSVIIVQLGDSGGVEPTNYLGSVVAPGTATVNLTSGFAISNDNAAAALWHGSMIITNIDGSNGWAAISNFGKSDSAAFRSMAGTKTLSAALDRIRLTTAGGADTFDAGSINILYE